MPPLVVCVWLKDPQDPEGAQLQSTPPLALSPETVAAIVAVPPAAIVVGGAVLIEIEMPADVVVGDDDDTAPQPEKHRASSETPAAANSPHFEDMRVCTLLSSLNWTSDPDTGHRTQCEDAWLPIYFQLH